VATASSTTYIHTCDLCGSVQLRTDLRRLGLAAIDEGGIVLRNPEIKGPPADVCPACQERPIAELVTLLETRKAERDSRPGLTW